MPPVDAYRSSEDLPEPEEEVPLLGAARRTLRGLLDRGKTRLKAAEEGLAASEIAVQEARRDLERLYAAMDGLTGDKAVRADSESTGFR